MPVHILAAQLWRIPATLRDGSDDVNPLSFYLLLSDQLLLSSCNKIQISQQTDCWKHLWGVPGTKQLAGLYCSLGYTKSMLGGQGQVMFLRKYTYFPSFCTSGMVYIKLEYTALHTEMDRRFQSWACPVRADVTLLCWLTNDYAVYGGTSGGESICKNKKKAIYCMCVRTRPIAVPFSLRESVRLKRRTRGKLAIARIYLNKKQYVLLPIIKPFIRVIDLTIIHIQVIVTPWP